MAIGKLSVVDGEDGRSIVGDLRTLRLAIKLKLVEVKDAKSDKAPSHLVYGNLIGHWCEIGRAWEMEVKRGENAGRPMFSIQFDDEEVKEHLERASAFPSEKDTFLIERDRSRNQQAVA